jgi:ferredoxin-NADP reductase
VQTLSPVARAAGDQVRTEAYELQVWAIRLEAEDTISIVLRDPDGADLPTWSPGAHLDLILPSGLIRQYSLCGSPRDRKTYRVAVLREQNGRGGSAELHSLPLVGRSLKVRGPRNHFELKDSPSYLFIAGGIGITPILAMIADLPPEAAWTLYYGGRSRRTMAFVDELTAIGGDRVHLVPEDEKGRLDLGRVLAGVGAETAIYCCGPAGLLRAVEERRNLLAPDAELYVERFTSAGEPRMPAEAGGGDDTEFVVELRRSQLVLTVPADRTLLSVIRDVLPEVAYSCEEGYCGTCETGVLAGIPDHRDELLSDEERAANTTMMTCVSRARSDRLVLDL